MNEDLDDTPPVTELAASMPPSHAAASLIAVLIAAIRAAGTAPVPAADVLAAAASSAAAVDRLLVEVAGPDGGRRLVLGWASGAAPDPTQHPSGPPRTLSPVPYMVWAACLGAAWPDPTAAPYPGSHSNANG